ncbi:MAG TPA: response regulator transcription factor [Campylobacterales bacterium]|nr:response regulator transcription factor [Campylobacterales bacterium]
MSAHIVLIEDEEDLLELCEYRLGKEGYEVTGFLSTKNVEELLLEEDVDLLIVDRNLPGVEGSEFVKKLRDYGYKTPVIFVSAKDQDKDIEEGFLRGGDDYLTKPFNMNELVLRVKSMLRRSKKSEEGKLLYKDITMDLDERRVYVSGVEVNLSKLEFELLSYFIQNKNIVLNRDQLLEEVWKDEEFKQEKTVNVTINRLRKKIDPDKNKEYIEPIRGIGYKLC